MSRASNKDFIVRFIETEIKKLTSDEFSDPAEYYREKGIREVLDRLSSRHRAEEKKRIDSYNSSRDERRKKTSKKSAKKK